MNFPKAPHDPSVIFALLTDFGDRDGFVGVMQGVIYSLLPPSATIAMVDITHGIERQNVWQGAWVLANSYAAFPPNTIFICVVDPHVGDASQAHLLLYWPERGYYFLAPDNGLLTPILMVGSDDGLQVYRIENRTLFRKDSIGSISHTFHGRDVYAPVAAHLAKAIQNKGEQAFLQTIGPRILNCQRLNWQPATRSDNCLHGQLMHIDIYGNLITNIPALWLNSGTCVRVSLAGRSWETTIFSSYSSGAQESVPFLVPSSGETLEITLYEGNAQASLVAQVGNELTLSIL